MVDRKAAATKKRPQRKGTSSSSNVKTAAASSPKVSEELPTTSTLEAAAPPSNPIIEPELKGEAAAISLAAEAESLNSVDEMHAKQHPHKSEPRILEIFLMDSGWNNPVGEVVRENIPAMAAYLKGHKFFVMSKEQSLNFIKRHAGLVGADPLLLVLDREAAKKKSPTGCGFRVSLGHVRQPEAALSMLKWAVQLTMTASTIEMTNMVRKSGHRETVQGVIELVGEGGAHLLEFAPV